MIKQNKSESVLELASGRGANSHWLAKNNLKVNFTGIDISDTQLALAFKYSKRLSNLYFVKGDYHDLSLLEDNTFDLCFIIEGLCHSDNTKKVFEEVYRVLKPGGLFYIADGYAGKSYKVMSKNERLAKRLVEIGMAVNEIKVYKDFVKLGIEAGFKIETEEDVSLEIIPTLRRFEKYAKAFLRLGPVAKLFLKILPDKFTWNILSGYLLPEVMNSGLGKYMITVFRKTGVSK